MTKQRLEIEINWITEDEATWPPENVRVNFGLIESPFCYSEFRIGDVCYEDRSSDDGLKIANYDYWFTMPEVKRPS